MTTQVAERDSLGVPAANVRRTAGERIALLGSRGGVHLALVIITLIWLVPSVGLLITSFRPKGDILASGWWTILAHPNLTLANYDTVLTTAKMGQAFLNSIYITVPATVLPVLVASMAAFAFAWIPFPGRDAVFLTIIALLVIPIQMTFVPVLQILNPLGLTKSYLGIWLAHTAYGLPFAIFLLRNFFILLPADLIESARIDGANNLQIFFRLIMPLSVPALASLTIFQFLGVWNDLLMALIFVNDPNARPLTVAISGLQSTYGIEWDLLSASAFLLMLLPLIVFFSLQRYFVQGLLAGAVK
jgi:alpha-glucoside transport system permease protein